MERILRPGTLVSRWCRRQTIADIRARAVRLGYDPAETLSRLGYASFVSRTRRYVYVETPKVACTAFKSMIAELENVRPDPNARPYMREARLDMLIHQRDHIALPSILDLTAKERASVFEGDPAWFIFAVVRNPFSRLVSVFENKVRIADPDFNHSVVHITGETQVDRVTLFRRFVRQIEVNENRVAENPHIATQSSLLLPDLIRYTNVFHIEALRDAMAAFNSHIALSGYEGVGTLPQRNAALRTEWRAYYDTESADIVQRVFAEDFRRFGYDPQDWHATGGGTVAEETDVEQYWREQVIARNEMINHLYDLLDARLGRPRRRCL